MEKLRKFLPVIKLNKYEAGNLKDERIFKFVIY
jgi:hypothetical protein